MNANREDWRELARNAVFDVRPLIGGAQTDAPSRSAFDVVNPATGRRLYSARASDQADVDAAVAAARGLVESNAMRRIDPGTRARILLDLAQRVEHDHKRLALFDSLETGKPVSSSMMEVQVAAQILRYCAGAVDKLHGAAAAPVLGALSVELLEPFGIAAVILPWNFPTIQAASRIGTAIATGNACMLKPSEMAMASSLALARAAIEYGWPEAAIAVLPGDGRVGHWLASHPDVHMVSFIGSTKTGQEVNRAAASNGFKRVFLECGGKSPTVVLADAAGLDLDLIASTIAQEVMWNQGQVCTARTRLIIERPLYDDLVGRVTAACAQWIPGDPLDEETNFGPLASLRQKQLVRGHVDRGIRRGARQIYGQEVVLPDIGEFVAPTVLELADPLADAFQEEIFGPVLSVIPARDCTHAFELANVGKYGLAASLWTTSLPRAHSYIRQVQAGAIRVNGSNELADEPLLASSVEPFKASGIGVEGGLRGFESWMRRKSAFLSFG